jgi:TusA-related sulfurtransferase
MADIVDARGYSCPQPVLMTLERIKQGGGDEIVVLVDTDTSKENVGRAAGSKGWRVKQTDQEGDGFRVTLSPS